jgi:hypothetical protein
MKDWLEFIERDVLTLFADLTMRDLQYPFALLLWIILLSLSLQGVERRDHIAGISYILYCTASAVALFLGLPGSFLDLADIGFHLAFVSLAIAVTSYRWFYSNDRLIIVSDDKTIQKKK